MQILTILKLIFCCESPQDGLPKPKPKLLKPCSLFRKNSCRKIIHNNKTLPDESKCSKQLPRLMKFLKVLNILNQRK